MAFTAGEVTNIANASLDWYVNKGETFKQALQARPLVDAFENNRETFPGGKEFISIGLLGDYGAGGVNDSLAGYTHDDTVSFYTPANIKRANFAWREMHIGFTMTWTELKIDGLSANDDKASAPKSHSRREMHVLVNLLKNKMHDFGERYARSLNSLLWGDGTADAKAIAGIRSIIVDVPTQGTVGGLSAVTYPWWRNRARTAAFAAHASFDADHGGGAITSSPANGGALFQTLQQEWRQLRRFGGRPNKFFAGSDFINAMEVEMRANGYYSQTGFKGTQDAAMGEMAFKGTPVIYDPTLDDLGLAKRAYIWDDRDIKLYAMEDEWRRQHTPGRPTDQFVLYRSLTCTGQIVTTKRNASLVIDIV